MLLRVIWCQVLNIIREESSSRFPGQCLNGLDPCYCERIKKMVFTVFNWNINYYNSCPFVLHVSEEPGSTFPSISLSTHFMCFHPLYHFGGHPLDLLYPCQHLSCIGCLKLDTFLQMKSHSTNEGHGHFTKITQGQSFKCQGLNFRMPLLGSLNMAE